MMSNESANPFAGDQSSAQRRETTVRWLLRLSTFLIVAVTVSIVAHIFIKGAPITFRKEFPFVNVKFLTELPGTLHVIFDKQGNAIETDVNGADGIKKQLGDNFREEKTISYSGGGILGPIVGTALLVVVSVTIALFLGVCSAIYLSEYASKGKRVEMIRLAILNLAGVPSVVFGLFGLGAFVLTAPVLTDTPHERSLLVIPLLFTKLSFQGWDTCVLSGGFTLAFVILPVIITASEQCLQAVPQGFRETSMALGATRWQTIWRAVLPFATPGILTSSILGIARAAGETAPIMFTAALAFKDKLPWQKDMPPLPADAGMFAHWEQSVQRFLGIFTESVQALPYHIYTLAARIPHNEYSERAQYGSVFVFLVLVASLAATSIWMRRRLRGKYKW
ncbi:PstA family ABC transporter permease [Brevifollis gellanilyticus]|uniref:Phosphate ABC transporter, permease protein PstA n=1 Tax=Brevifollis gellanilyticus TaxID=748831 RepID=A0A512M701_9BACT|nr:PstA family ABC transporter permease [Brevifollis gellanilyticus]GEP42518.1 phosphate ABC transporter, permease protein PstA [Brevifollis gellanilyticus]